jgi:hypothetical protein
VPEAVKRLLPTLQTSKIEGEDAVGRFTRGRRKVLRYFGFHPDAEIRVDLPPLHDRLEKWVVTAAERVGLDRILDGVACEGRPTSAKMFGKRFRDALRHELALNPNTQYRRTLLARLAADEWERVYRERELRESALGLALGSSTLGAAAGAVVAIPVGADTATAAAVGAGVALIAGTAGVIREAQRRVTPEQEVIRRAVRSWIWDFLSQLLDATEPAEPKSLGREQIEQKLTEVLTREEPSNSIAIPMTRPPTALVTDLGARLIPRCRDTDDQDVVFGLIQVEDALARWGRAPDDRTTSARQNIYEPLRNLIDATRLPDEPS